MFNCPIIGTLSQLDAFSNPITENTELNKKYTRWTKLKIPEES